MSATQVNQQKIETKGPITKFACGCIDCESGLFTPRKVQQKNVTISMTESYAINHSENDCEYCSNKNNQPEEPHWTPSNSGTQTTGSQEQKSSLQIPVFPSDDDLFITL